MADLTEIIQLLGEMKSDDDLPQRVRESIIDMKEILEVEDEDPDIKINTCLEKIEEFGDSCDIDSYSRTKIWSLVSKLEEFNAD